MMASGSSVGILALWAALSLPAAGQDAGGGDLTFRGQASAWFSLATGAPSTPRFGLRYIPQLLLGSEDGKGHRLDAEFSAKAYLTGAAPAWRNLSTEGRIREYRMWIRLSSPRSELRAGLQKINFGSASIFRPLMWFDRVDARDPLQITDGVWGLLGRIYFANNANIWLWGLVGNNKPKGWETAPTKKSSVEYGARVQSPLFKGEVALTYHRRTTDLSELPVAGGSEEGFFVPEDRVGIDGKWDVGIGLWFEATLIRQNDPSLPLPFQRSLVIGADTTFGLGNGLTVLGEHFELVNSERAFGGGEGLRLTAISLSAPLGLLDNLAAFVYYDWESGKLFRTLSWRRTTDHWQFLLLGFWNPEESPLFEAEEGSNLFGGAGIQIMVVFNH